MPNLADDGGITMRHMLAGLSVGLLAASPLASQSYPDGDRIFRVHGGVVSRLINGAQDELYVGISRPLLPKDKGFKNDDEAGMLITTRIIGRKVDGPFETLNFSQIYTARVQDYSTDLVSLPLDATIVPGFALSSDGYRYTSMEFFISFLKSRKNTGFGSVVKGLAKLTSRYAFPSSPFADEGLRRHSELTADLLSEDKDGANGIEARIPVSRLSLFFAPKSGAVASFVDSTGVFAIIFGGGNQASLGYVDILRPTGTCLTVATVPARALLTSRRDGNGNCMPSAEEVTNAYAMFYVTTLQRIASASSITTYKGSWKDLAWASDQGPSHDSMFPAWLSNDLKASSYTVVKSLLNGDTAAALRGNSTLRRDGKSAFWSFQGRDAALADYANAIAIGDMLGVDTKKMGFKVTSPHARIVP